MTIITTFNLAHSSDQFREYVSLLFHLAIKGERNGVETTPAERIERVSAMTDAYVACRDCPPEASQLDRLASLILRNELTDKRKNKMQAEEYPIMSDDQYNRRTFGVHTRKSVASIEVGLEAAANIGTDGRDYRIPTRRYEQ